MKTPYEIKKGLECCPGQYSGVSCGNCPYSNDGRDCGENGVQIMKDALAYIQQLEAGVAQWEDVATSPGAVEDMALKINRLEKELETVKRERDAAVVDISLMPCACDVCVHGITQSNDCERLNGNNWCSFEWRGVCPENAEVQEDDQRTA